MSIPEALLLLAVGRLQQADRRAQVATAVTNIPAFGPLVGRLAEVTARTDLAEGCAMTISGLGGMGKSHLAFAVTRDWSSRGLVDTVVHASLRGNDVQSPPADPVAVQEALLRALGRSGAGRYDDARAPCSRRFSQNGPAPLSLTTLKTPTRPLKSFRPIWAERASSSRRGRTSLCPGCGNWYWSR